MHPRNGADANIIKQKVGFSLHKQHKTETTNNRTEMPSREANDYIQFFHRGKQSTKERNALKLKKFCLWLNKAPEQVIAEYEEAKENNDLDGWEREQVNRVLKYYNYLLEHKYAINYARSEASGILAFHKQNTTRLEDVTREFAPPQLPTNEY